MHLERTIAVERASAWSLRCTSNIIAETGVCWMQSVFVCLLLLLECIWCLFMFCLWRCTCIECVQLCLRDHLSLLKAHFWCNILSGYKIGLVNSLRDRSHVVHLFMLVICVLCGASILRACRSITVYFLLLVCLTVCSLFSVLIRGECLFLGLLTHFV